MKHSDNTKARQKKELNDTIWFYIKIEQTGIIPFLVKKLPFSVYRQYKTSVY